MQKRWLFEKVEGRHTALGDAEELIAPNDRAAFLDAIPHGWRLTRYDDTQWTFSRLVSLSVPFKVVCVVESILDTVLPDQNKGQQPPSGWSSIQNALFTCGPEDAKPLLSVIGNVLKHVNGSCGVYKDVEEDNAQHGFELLNTDPNPFRARDDLMSLELRMVVPTISDLRLHDVESLRDSVLDNGFPVHPSFDGQSLESSMGCIMALHLALRAIKTCADAACECMYDVSRMREWWFERAYSMGTKTIKALSETTYGQPVEAMTSLCTTICASLFPTIALSGLFMHDTLPICTYALMAGVQNNPETSSVKEYAAYLCRDEDSAEHVLRSLSVLLTISQDPRKIVDLPDHDRISDLLVGNDKNENIQAFVELAPFSKRACEKFQHVKTGLGMSKDRIGLICGAVSQDILHLIFGDAALVDEYYKFNNYKVTGLDRTLLAPNSIWDGEGSLAHIMESL